MTKDHDKEFERLAASIAIHYAEWHKETPCRNAVEKALAEAYAKGRQDAGPSERLTKPESVSA